MAELCQKMNNLVLEDTTQFVYTQCASFGNTAVVFRSIYDCHSFLPQNTFFVHAAQLLSSIYFSNENETLLNRIQKALIETFVISLVFQP